jgi:peroxiredoxin
MGPSAQRPYWIWGLLLIFFFAGTSPLKAAALKVGDPAPSFTLTALKSGKLTVPKPFTGKVLILHFWASWCPYCVKEMLAINSSYKKYKSKGLVAFSINVGESSQAAEAYVAPLGVTYPILLDPKSDTAKLYGVTGIPTSFIIDRNGKIRFKILGEIGQEGLNRLLPTLMGKI